jgi:hypothetical protein
MARAEPAFLLGEFAEPAQMLAAASALRHEGWRVELHAPFPVEGMREALGFGERTVPRAFLIGGILGALSGFGLQAYTNLAYPLDVGGRPLIAVPAFMLITFELMVLFAVLAGIGAMFVKNRLPRLHHPLFDAERFHLASDNRFFVSLALVDCDEGAARRALDAQHPAQVTRVGGEVPE